MALDDFITHSQYPQEKIVWAYEGVVDNTNPYWDANWDYGIFVPVPDTLNADDILLDGVWTNDDWTTSYPIGTPSRVYGWYQDEQSFYQDYDEANASVVKPQPYWVDYNAFYANCSSSANKTIQVRLWAYLISSDMASSVNWKTSEQLARSLQKTTALAQLNMISENIIVVHDDETIILHHNLGFKPLCKIWEKWQSGTWTISAPTFNIIADEPDTNLNITITDTTIAIHAIDIYGEGNSRTFAVRLYNYATP